MARDQELIATVSYSAQESQLRPNRLLVVAHAERVLGLAQERLVVRVVVRRAARERSHRSWRMRFVVWLAVVASLPIRLCIHVVVLRQPAACM